MFNLANCMKRKTMSVRNRWRRASLVMALLLASLLPSAMIHTTAAQAVPAQAAGNTLTLAPVTAAPGTSGVIAVLLDNRDAVASGQLRFTYAAVLGVTITGVQLTSRTSGFTSTGSAFATGDPALLGYQVLFYNLSNLTIAPGAGAILNVTFTTTPAATGSSLLHITQAILVNAAATALAVTPVDGLLTIASTAPMTSTPLPPTATATAIPSSTPTATTGAPQPAQAQQLYLPMIYR